jgi:hypothetical protein
LDVNRKMEITVLSLMEIRFVVHVRVSEKWKLHKLLPEYVKRIFSSKFKKYYKNLP